MAGNHIPENVDAIATWHVDIQYQQVPSALAQLVQCLLASCRLVHFPDGLVVQEDLPQPGADYCVIINNEYSVHQLRLSQ
jgi:hypothetical protein